MSTNGDRVTNKQLYEALWGLDQKLQAQITAMPDKAWVARVVGGALVLNQLLSRLPLGKIFQHTAGSLFAFFF